MAFLLLIYTSVCLHFQELHFVVGKVQPALPDVLAALERYHLHSADGWITTAG